MAKVKKSVQTGTPRSASKAKAKIARNGNGGAMLQSGAQVAAPIAYAASQRFPRQGARMKSHRFSNSELVSSVLGSVAFSATKFAVNPGLAASFPWLSIEAGKWEQYRFHKLQYRFVTRTSTASVGSVILSPEYDVRDPAPSTEVQATDTQDAVEDAVWKELCCVLDPGAMYPTGARKLVRVGNIAGDTNLYDSANLFVCTVEEADASAIGKLWVDYDVEFFVPQNSSLTAPKAAVASYGGRLLAQTFTTGVAALLDFDALTEDPLGIGSDSSGSWTPPQGSYDVKVNAILADSTNESSVFVMEILKNGSSLSPKAFSQEMSADAGGEMRGMYVQGIVNCSGSDTISVRVTMTGAAGTLTSVAASPYIIFRVA